MILVAAEARSECAPISHLALDLALPRPWSPIKLLTGNEKKWRRGWDSSRPTFPAPEGSGFTSNRLVFLSGLSISKLGGPPAGSARQDQFSNPPMSTI